MTTKIHAKLIADMLSDDARVCMQIFGRVVTAREVSKDGIDELVQLGLASHDVNILDNDKPVFLLTPLGKKVVKEIDGTI